MFGFYRDMKREYRLKAFIIGLVRFDPDAALEWANAVGDENFRHVVVENVSKRISRQ